MSLQRAYHHLSEEKRAAIMALAREGFSGAHIARHCGISEATVSREFSRQFSKGIPLKERRQRYEASAACARYREKRERSKPKGKLFPSIIETAEKFFRCGYSPEQMAHTVLNGKKTLDGPEHVRNERFGVQFRGERPIAPGQWCDVFYRPRDGQRFRWRGRRSRHVRGDPVLRGGDDAIHTLLRLFIGGGSRGILFPSDCRGRIPLDFSGAPVTPGDDGSLVPSPCALREAGARRRKIDFGVRPLANRRRRNAEQISYAGRGKKGGVRFRHVFSPGWTGRPSSGTFSSSP